MPMLDEQHKDQLQQRGWRAINAPDREGDTARRARGFSGFGGLKPPSRLNVRVPPGTILFSPGARTALSLTGEMDHEKALEILERFIEGDWGPDTPPEVAMANTQNIETNGQVRACYNVGHGMMVWLISDPDRSATTFVGAGELQQ